MLLARKQGPGPNRIPDRRSPDGIRTRATALRGRRARPLHNGANATIVAVRNSTGGRIAFQTALGYQDSNLD